MLPRHSLGFSRADLVFRALLGQPLILYGHHQDFAHGLDLFAQAASDVNSLGDVRWGPLGRIARGNYSTRRAGEILHVRMHARRISLAVPDGIRALRVQAPEPLGGAGWHELEFAGQTVEMTFRDGLGESPASPVDAPAEPAELEVRLIAERPLLAAEIPARSFRPWPRIRRVLVEGARPRPAAAVSRFAQKLDVSPHKSARRAKRLKKR